MQGVSENFDIILLKIILEHPVCLKRYQIF